MDKSIHALAAQRAKFDQDSTALLNGAVQLEAQLNGVFDGLRVYAVSDVATLEQVGVDEWCYGRLAYSDRELKVQHRVTEDDLADDHHGIPDDERNWRVTSIRTCPPAWREHLMDEKIVHSLTEQLRQSLAERQQRLDRSLSALDGLLDAESVVLDAGMCASLDATGDENLTRLWQDAVEATHADTADALTRCSRFLEAVCATILRERAVPLPRDKSMHPLVKTCLDTLSWPAAKEAEADVRQLLGGIQAISNGIGALRTHFGTAHGATSHLPPLDFGYAVFVKQATVAVAIFLLDRHQASPPAAGATPEPDDQSDPDVGKG